MAADTAPVHLLLGPELGDKGQWIKDIRNNLRTLHGSDPEIHRFYPFETENGEIFTALDNNSLFADHRLVLLSQAESASVALAKQLAEYAKHPSSSATLLIISSETSIANALMSAIPKDCTKVFYEMFDNQKPTWVRNLFNKNGYAIEDGAVELVLELIDNNTQELRSACNQLMAFLSMQPDHHTTTVTEDDIEQYLHHTRQESVFTLFASMLSKGLGPSLSTLHTLVSRGEGDSVPLIAGLLWQYRRLESFLELVGSGSGIDEACRNTKVAGKSSAIRRKADQQMHAEASRTHSLSQVRSIIARLAEFDIKTRECATDVQLMLLEHMLDVCVTKKGTPYTTSNHAKFTTDAKF